MSSSHSSSSSDRAELAARLQPYLDRARNFSGWDFSSVDQRIIGPGLPWDYDALAREKAAKAVRVLDLGTGGGEVLSRIAQGLETQFVATEEWHVNAPIACNRLRPLGIPVVRARSDGNVLPFPAGCFDLVLSRHEGVKPAEVDRVLAPGGTFLTQQVMPDNWPELTRHFPRKMIFPDHFNGYRDAFLTLRYSVTRQQHDLRTAYRTLGDVAVMLAVTPWYIADLDVEDDADALLAVERELTTPDGIVLTEGRYLLEARKPA